jgi:hypothetical protein
MNFNFYSDKSATKGRMSAGLKVYKKIYVLNLRKFVTS